MAKHILHSKAHHWLDSSLADGGPARDSLTLWDTIAMGYGNDLAAADWSHCASEPEALIVRQQLAADGSGLVCNHVEVSAGSKLVKVERTTSRLSIRVLSAMVPPAAGQHNSILVSKGCLSAAFLTSAGSDFNWDAYRNTSPGWSACFQPA